MAKPGKGRVWVNDYLLENMTPEVARMKILEPLMIAGEKGKVVDIRVSVEGGARGESKKTEILQVNGLGMIIPVRCFTCGKLIGDKWETFSQRVRAGDKPSKALDELGLRRYCCRRMMITHVEIIDEFLKFPQVSAKKRAELI